MRLGPSKMQAVKIVTIGLIITCCCLIGHNHATTTTPQQRPQILQDLSKTHVVSTNQPARYKLKFQIELDQSTLSKSENQSQTFKCQVRLAPTSYLNKLVKLSFNQLLQERGWNQTNMTYMDKIYLFDYQPFNVSLAIDWFKDGKKLTESSKITKQEQQSGPSSIFNSLFKASEQQSPETTTESISVINVELKSYLSGLNASSGGSSKNEKTKTNKTRLEIKNTINLNQLKLTSRLKLNRLKQSDSGHYKCVATARYDFALGVAAADPRSALDRSTSPEQSLVSNEIILLINNNSSLATTKTASEGLSSGIRQFSDNSKTFKKNRNPRIQFQFPSALETRMTGQQPLRYTAAAAATAMATAPANDLGHANTNGGDIKIGESDGNNAGISLPVEIINRDNITDFQQIGKLAPTTGPPNSGLNLALAKAGGAGSALFEDDEDLYNMTAEINNDATGTSPGVAVHQLQNQEINDDDLESVAQSSDDFAQLVDNNHNQRHTNDSPAADNGSHGNPMSDDDRPSRQHKSYNQGPSLPDWEPDHWLKGHDSKNQFVKLVHKITNAPELSCYTNFGELYRGNISQSSDDRECLNWSKVMRLNTNNDLLKIFSSDRDKRLGPNANMNMIPLQQLDNKYCRNFNLDPRGPWCFVQYNAELDASDLFYYNPIRFSSNDDITFIQKQCSISACSSYLWLYIVAPPLALLILLMCLIVLIMGYIRKQIHKRTVGPSSSSVSSSLSSKAIISPASKKNRSSYAEKLGRLFDFTSPSSRRFAPKKFVNEKKHDKNYLDDDIFEISDDLDWSDGHQTSNQFSSPKSNESLKLSDSSADRNTKLGRKLVNPIFNDSYLTSSNDLLSNNNNNNHQHKSSTQLGPMFATLRCQISNNRNNKLGVSVNNKSETLYKNSKRNQMLATSAENAAKDANNWLSDYNMNGNKLAINHSPSTQSSSPSSTSHLISCSTTAEDNGKSKWAKFIGAHELPLISSKNVSIAANQQLLYEGKFNQVQLAYISSDGASLSMGCIGTQVSLLAMKQASVSADYLSIFEPTNLKLRNLNHLNLLKLIGYIESSSNENNEADGIGDSSPSICSLVFDMNQLVDLKDWLKQQSEDSLISDEPGEDLRLRKNLTCITKQIALALDYLHDQDIIFKDLACRNCFLDPTKMLVKLASFNLELIIGDEDDDYQSATNDDRKLSSLKSLIRPKYLLDYYIIDSRPSNCQLLPLSWIPLESILFNKFNKQTDVWSFGCLIYELFSLGEVAYFGYSSKQIIDLVRSNLMPPQSLLCPSGLYKLMRKCLSDIPTNRPNVKQIYEQLNLCSGQCSSFLDHHLCSLNIDITSSSDNQQQQRAATGAGNSSHLIEFKLAQNKVTSSVNRSNSNSITKTKSFVNIKCQSSSNNANNLKNSPEYCNLMTTVGKPEVAKIPLSKSINLTSSRLISYQQSNSPSATIKDDSKNHYDEPILN